MIHVMKSMKNPETCHQARKNPVTTQFNRFRVRFIATVCAAIAACFVLTGHAQNNLLVNPGLEAGTFSGWTAHTTESWSMQAQKVTDPMWILVYDGSWCLWMQGLYGNGGAPVPYTSYAFQTFACSPGSQFTADGWFSQYVWQNLPHASDGSFNENCLFGANAGTEDGWIEVLFLSSTNVATTTNILADYKSRIIDPALVANLASSGLTVSNITATTTNIWLVWGDYPVTNQYDISTITNVSVNTDPDTDAAGITNTLGIGQYMTAPPGTKYVQLRVCLDQVTSGASGAPCWDDFTLIQHGGQSASVIGSIWPDGSQFFNIASTNFTFSVTSASTGGYPLATNQTSGIQVLVSIGGGTSTDVSGSLQFSGTPTNLNVTYPGLLASAVYNISISVSNTAGLISSKSVSFDTFPTNCFIVSSEDYDFTNGMFFENPIPTAVPAPNSYTGLGSTWGVDQDTYGGVGLLPAGASELVRADGCVAFQVAGGAQLPLYLAQSNPAVYNVAIAYNNGGNWENYTRVYPTNYYAVYARMSSETVAEEYLNLLTSGYGTATQTTNNLGVFYDPVALGYSNYKWVPLTYSAISGSQIVTVHLPPGTNTLQLLSGGCNFEFFMFVPFSGGIPPFFSNLSLPAQPAFQSGITNITCTVYSVATNILANQIYAYLNGQNVSSTATYTPAGSAAYGVTNWTVSVPVPPGQTIQTFYLGAVDAAGLSNTIPLVTFDTFSQSNFMIEAEDFDFNGGQFITNPIPTGAYVNGAYPAYAYSPANSYFYFPEGDRDNAAIVGVDLTTVLTDAAETFLYRPAESAGTQVATDFLRQKFYVTNGATVTTFSDFNLGFWDPGQWVNYTRAFPTNTYNVYGRLASSGAYSGLSLSLVTSGVGTPTQTTNLLGTFSDPNASGWQAWDWVQLLNSNGQLAVVSLGGVETLQANNTTAGSVNANFYMLVPAVVAPQAVHLSVSRTGSTISIQFPTKSGVNYTVLYSGSLNPANWQTLTTISGDGTVQTATDTMGSSPRFYRVSFQ
jgi:hypothetical protein